MSMQVKFGSFVVIGPASEFNKQFKEFKRMYQGETPKLVVEGIQEELRGIQLKVLRNGKEGMLVYGNNIADDCFMLGRLNQFLGKKRVFALCADTFTSKTLSPQDEPNDERRTALNALLPSTQSIYAKCAEEGNYVRSAPETFGITQAEIKRLNKQRKEAIKKRAKP